MKKIININLSGRVIPIEDSAYEKLQNYIESLRRYFAKEESRDEIINDIESRIAELLHDKVRKGAANITDEDIDQVISSMGRPEDLEAEEAAEATASASSSSQSGQQQYTYSEKRSKGRLYRDSSDKFIAGVCSGLAAYMNVDPAIVRILFAIVTFGGFGLGFLIYLVLWMVLPAKDIEGYAGKRLYRNPDDKMFGGVAGGLAAYFDKSTKTIRLIFAAPILLSAIIGILKGITWDYDFDFFLNLGFGSLSGTFILIYVVLWIVLPEANTDYEKMEMRGEKVDVNRIRQNVKEGMGNVKDRMKEWGEEVKSSAQNFSSKAKEFTNTRGKAFASEFNETAKRSSRGIGHAIGVIFKAFFLFIAGTIAFALFVSLIALLFGGVAWWPINNFLWTSKGQQIYAWGTLIFFLIVPLVGFIIWLVRRIIGVRRSKGYLGWTFGLLWTLGWISVVLLGASLSKDFREFRHIDTPLAIAQPANGKMIVAVSEPELEFTGRFDWMDDGGNGWDLTDDTIKLSTVRFDFQKSVDADYHVIIKKSGYGRTEEEAFDRAEKIQYRVSFRDSILDLGNGYAIGKQNKFRFQQVEIEIQIPAGKKIRFDRTVNEKLNPTNFKIRRKGSRRRGVDLEFENNYSQRLRSEVDYTMGNDNLLRDSEGNLPENNNHYYYNRRNDSNRNNNNSDYRYNDDNRDTSVKPGAPSDIQRQIDEEKRKKEESERRIKDLEEKQKAKDSKPIVFKTKDHSEEGSFVSGPSPVSSMAEWF